MILIVEDDENILEMYKDQGLTNVARAYDEAIWKICNMVSKYEPITLFCDGNIPNRVGGISCSKYGLQVLEFAQLAGVKQRWITSGDYDIVQEALSKGLATDTCRKENVKNMVQE